MYRFHRAPTIFPKLFPQWKWRIPPTGQEKTVYLTFDDGPIPELTPMLLDILADFNIKASFFCVGENVEKHPGIFNRILSEGHSVGNHSHNHCDAWKIKSAVFLQNVGDCQEVFLAQALFRTWLEERQAKGKPVLFRPPYGHMKTKISKALIDQGYEIMMWDVLSYDFDRSLSPESCLSRTVQKTRPGSIVVFHDNVKATERVTYAVPKYIEALLRQGYQFKLF